MAEPSEGPITTYARGVIRWRWLVLLATIAITLGLGSGARFLSLANDYRVFFGEENPQLQSFEALERIYTKNDNIVFVMQPADGDVFTQESLSAVLELTEAAWQIPFSTRVDSLTNFQYTRAEEDDLMVADLVSDPRSLAKKDLEDIRQIAQNEPMLRTRMISANSSTTGVNVRLQVPGKSLSELPKAANYARQLRDQIVQKYPDIKIMLSGSAMLSNAFAEAPQADFTFLVPLMYATFILTMLICFRSLTGTFISVLLIAMSALTAMGTAGWMLYKLNGVSATAPTIILTVAIADSVHILISMLNEMRRGATQQEAIVESLRINAQPVFLTSLTTAIGFLSLRFSDAPPIQHLGTITAIGVIAAWAYSMTFLPAALAILPIRSKQTQEKENKWIDRFAEFVIRNYRKLGLGMAALVCLLTAAIPLFEINDRPVEYFDDSFEFRRGADFAMEHLVGIYAFSYSLNSGEASGINEPEYLQTVEDFANWFREKPSVVHVASFTDTMKRLNKNMHGDDPSYYQLPKERELAAQYLLLYEMSLPYGLDIGDQINVDKSATRLDVTFGDVDFKIVKQIKSESQQWLRENAPPSMYSEPSSPAVMFAYIAERNIYAMISGTAIALGLISLIMIIALRNVKIGSLSILPNLIPIVMAFGFWAILYREVGFAISMVAGVSIGIIVDDSVHFLSKYLRARREQNLSAPDAIRYAFHTVATALILTSVILVIGFALLSTSAFWPNATLGLLTALTIACALAADFLLLPFILLIFDRDKETL